MPVCETRTDVEVRLVSGKQNIMDEPLSIVTWRVVFSRWFRIGVVSWTGVSWATSTSPISTLQYHEAPCREWFRDAEACDHRVGHHDASAMDNAKATSTSGPASPANSKSDAVAHGASFKHALEDAAVEIVNAFLGAFALGDTLKVFATKPSGVLRAPAVQLK